MLEETDLPKWWWAVSIAVAAPFFFYMSHVGDSGRAWLVSILVAIYFYIGSMFWKYRGNIALSFAFTVISLIHLIPAFVVNIGAIRFPGIAAAPIFAIDAIIVYKILEFIAVKE